MYSFAFQLDNGVPIVGFYDDPKDEEMLHLKFYLECLKDCDDVREKNREAFQLMQLADTQLQRILEEQQRHRAPFGRESDPDPYQQRGGNYSLPEQAQHGPNSNSFVVDEHDEFEQEDEDEDELARDPCDDTHAEMQAMQSRQSRQAQRQHLHDAGQASEHFAMQNSNIVEEEFEDDEDSFECRL